jgi:hypothetical protein
MIAVPAIGFDLADSPKIGDLAPVAPAVAYAIHKATKTRVRSMPFESSRKS